MKMSQILKSTIAIASLIQFGLSIHASEIKDFNEKAFQSAQAQGKTIVLDFHADWCGTCAQQEKSLKSVLTDPKLQSVVGFKVDFDRSDKLKQVNKVQKQSTLIVFKGSTEVARAMGITEQKEIASLLAKGL